MELNLSQLEAFCKVAELESFSKAAEALHLAQASVSERVSNLEAQVGCRLLDRLGRKTVPTDAGRTLLRHALRLLKQRDDVVQEMRRFTGVQQGVVRIGASSVPGEYILPQIVADFRKSYSGLAVALDVSDSRAVLDQVSEGLADVGFVGVAGPAKGIEFTPLWHDQLVLVVPPSHNLARRKSVGLPDLPGHPFVSREQGSATFQALASALAESTGSPPLDLDIVAVLNSATAVKNAIIHGLGVSVMSERSVRTEEAAGLLRAIPIKGASLARNFHMVCASKLSPSPGCVAFMNFVRRYSSNVPSNAR